MKRLVPVFLVLAVAFPLLALAADLQPVEAMGKTYKLGPRSRELYTQFVEVDVADATKAADRIAQANDEKNRAMGQTQTAIAEGDANRAYSSCVQLTDACDRLIAAIKDSMAIQNRAIKKASEISKQPEPDARVMGKAMESRLRRGQSQDRADLTSALQTRDRFKNACPKRGNS